MEMLTILGFDPGKNLGYSRLIVHPLTFEIQHAETRIYYLDQQIYSPFGMFNKVEYLKTLIHSILLETNPTIVGMEQVFKHRFANAVIQLSQYTSAIEYQVRSYDPYLLFYTYPPKVVKKLIGATGDADKYKMLETISKNSSLVPYLKPDITEHEVDALAISYISLETFKKCPETLLLSYSNFIRRFHYD